MSSRHSLQSNYPRGDYKELLCLAASMIGIQTNTAVRKPGALYRAHWMAKAIYCLKMVHWMAKAIYCLKMELLFDGNEAVFHLTAQELQGIQRFNIFVVRIYISSVMVNLQNCYGCVDI